jgi:hypothetical protein
MLPFIVVAGKHLVINQERLLWRALRVQRAQVALYLTELTEVRSARDFADKISAEFRPSCCVISTSLRHP